MNEYTFTWFIDRFSPNHLLTEPKQIHSPVFNAENLNETSWFLILTFDSKEECFACSLVRYHSEKEETEIIEINYSIDITVDDRKIGVKVGRKKETFKKGDANRWGSFKFGSSAAKLLLRCNMLDCISRENPTSVGITILSELGHLSWSPSCMSDTTSFCGAEITEFEVCLKNVDDKVSLRISRIDKVKTFSCFLMCKMFAHDKANWKYSREIDHMRNTLNYNQPFDLPLGLECNKITKSGIYVINIYFNCSILVGMMRSMLQEKIGCPIESDSMSSSNAVDALRNDLKMMYTKKTHTDLELKVDNKLFFAHKFILLARSPVFQKMFEQDMVENQTGVVDIPDVNAKIFEMFLNYMYTGSCDLPDWESTLNLILVAEKYQISSLKKDCSDYLIKTLSENNVCEILNAADMVSDSNLKGCAMDYIKLHAAKVLFSDSWKGFIKSNVRLADEIFSKLSTVYGGIATDKEVSTSDSAQLNLLDDESESYFSTYLTSATMTNTASLPDSFLV